MYSTWRAEKVLYFYTQTEFRMINGGVFAVFSISIDFVASFLLLAVRMLPFRISVVVVVGFLFIFRCGSTSCVYKSLSVRCTVQHAACLGMHVGILYLMEKDILLIEMLSACSFVLSHGSRLSSVTKQIHTPGRVCTKLTA